MTRRIAAAAIAALCLAACAEGRLPQLTTAASMRVEVEVYKGPAANTPDVQWGEFVGALAEIESFFLSLPNQRFNDAKLLDNTKMHPVEREFVEQIYLDLSDLGFEIAFLRARAQIFNNQFYETRFGSNYGDWNVDALRKIPAILFSIINADSFKNIGCASHDKNLTRDQKEKDLTQLPKFQEIFAKQDTKQDTTAAIGFVRKIDT